MARKPQISDNNAVRNGNCAECAKDILVLLRTWEEKTRALQLWYGGDYVRSLAWPQSGQMFIAHGTEKRFVAAEEHNVPFGEARYFAPQKLRGLVRILVL
jgi:hypothetical protein